MVVFLMVMSHQGYSQCCNANFSANPESGLTWKFYPEDPNSLGITLWKWEFGDGSKSMAKSPVHKYKKQGTYWVTLTKVSRVKDSLISTCSIKKRIYVYKNIIVPCQAKFSATNAGAVFNFKNESSSNASNRRAYWSFGDGTSASTWDASHRYTKSGSYTVTLFVSVSNQYQSDSCFAQKQIQVQVPCQAEFTFMQNKNVFSFYYDNQEGIPNSYWTFGDGTYGYGSQVSHEYKAVGMYNVCHFVYDSLNLRRCESCQQVSVFSIPNDTCDASFQYQLNGNTVSMIPNNHNAYSYWTFGASGYSGDSAASFTFTQPGVYEICHVAISNGFTDTCRTCQLVNIAIPTDTCTNTFQYSTQGLSFQGYGSPADSINNYASWSFGDGQYGNGTQTQHTFAAPGSYQVCYTVYNLLRNDTCSYCQVVNVSSPADSCQLSIYTQQSDRTIWGSGTAPGPNQYASWSFGDGNHSSGANFQHYYQQYGTYRLCYTLLDPTSMDTCTTCREIRIEKPADTCIINASYQQEGYVINFYGNIPSSHQTARWHFGDGQYGFDSTATHQYTQPGIYEVCYYLFNNLNGDTCTKCFQVRIDSLPCQADFTYQIINDTIRLRAANLQGIHQWSTSNGMTSFSGMVNFPVSNQQGYTLSVCYQTRTAFDSCRVCKDIDLQKPSVNPNPASDYITVESPFQALKSLHLFDMNGYLKLQKQNLQATTEQLNVTTLSSGTYTLRVVYGNQNQATYTIIIQR